MPYYYYQNIYVFMLTQKEILFLLRKISQSKVPANHIEDLKDEFLKLKKEDYINQNLIFPKMYGKNYFLTYEYLSRNSSGKLADEFLKKFSTVKYLLISKQLSMNPFSIENQFFHYHLFVEFERPLRLITPKNKEIFNLFFKKEEDDKILIPYLFPGKNKKNLIHYIKKQGSYIEFIKNENDRLILTTPQIEEKLTTLGSPELEDFLSGIQKTKVLYQEYIKKK